ncbi:MAG: DUF447 domain-containing protein [Haloarculaceae archaeon]
MSSDNPSDRDRPAARWPADLRGVTESVVTTLGPNGLWNVAALGLEAAASGPSGAEPARAEGEPDRVTARTWGRTRTRLNFSERGEGYVQFTTDPVDFVEAALAVRERDDPVLESAAAWARVTVERVEAGRSEGTEWVQWRLHPVESVVRAESVPTINRGFNALVEATVVASRLGVGAYESEPLEDRLAYLIEVVERCGGSRETEALERLRSLRED